MFGGLVQDYLLRINYELNGDNINCRGKLFIEAILSIIYCCVSIVLLWDSKVEIIVTVLNAICAIRTSLHCLVQMSMADLVTIDESRERFNFYHIKAAGMVLVLFVLALVLFAVILDSKKSEDTNVIKTVSSITLLMVCLNDCHDLAVCAYDARVR